LESEYPDLEIILVDNGSRDQSVKKISQAVEHLTIIELPANVGFTGGYNAGIQRAMLTDTNHVFLLNNDTIIEKNTISKLVKSNWDIAVPKITFHDAPNQIWAAGAKWRPFPPTIKMIGYKQPDSEKFSRSYPLNFATGCALMVRREVFEKISGFDPLFKNYMEDYDFSYRASEAGFSMGYVPGTQVKHKVSRSLGQESKLRWSFLGRNTVIFYRRHDRFPIYTTWIAIGWIMLREFVQGNARVLPAFWSGVREGFEICRGEA
jgi:GT2 family glycosyltransferase